jgi:flagellar biosynthesis protein FlhG
VRDQAAALREAPTRAETLASGERDAIVFGSGKGGVGKSVLSVAVAREFARAGKRTLLLDGAQNQGNLHILLGVRPAAPLTALLAGDVTAADLLVPVAPGLSLLPADSGAETLYGLGAIDRARLHHRLSGLYDRFDAVIVDGGPGLESVVRAAGIRASRLIVVTAPEPAALSDAYALMKICHLQLPSLALEVMVNRVDADEEGQAVHDRLRLAAQRFLHRDIGYLGCLHEQEALRLAARRPGAMLETEVEGIGTIVARLLSPSDQVPSEGMETRGIAS